MQTAWKKWEVMNVSFQYSTGVYLAKDIRYLLFNKFLLNSKEKAVYAVRQAAFHGARFIGPNSLLCFSYCQVKQS